MMARSMTRLMIVGNKYALHVFGVYRPILISKEIQLIKIQ